MWEITNSNGKIMRAFEKFTKKSQYRDLVSQARKKMEISETGLVYTRQINKRVYSEYQHPLIIPFVESAEVTSDDRISYYSSQYADQLLNEFGMKNLFLKKLIKYHIIFNEFFIKELSIFSDNNNLCRLTNADQEFEKILPMIKDFDSVYMDIHHASLYKDMLKYPIVLKIHPEATQRDIFDFIKQKWKMIEKMQESYKDIESNHSFKTSKHSTNTLIKKRNEFIWKHRDLSSKENSALTNRKFGGDIEVDHGIVNKVISQEKRLRK